MIRQLLRLAWIPCKGYNLINGNSFLWRFSDRRFISWQKYISCAAFPFRYCASRLA